MSQAGPTARPGTRLGADLSLLAVAAIWGTGFVACRVAVAHLGPFLYNGLRFLLAAAVLLPVAARQRGSGPMTPWQWRGALTAGLVLFGASGIQQVALQSTTAGKAGFITGMYVVLVPLFLAIGWRQRVPRAAWLASMLATGGLLLLSGTGTLALAPGDALLAVAVIFWALHVIVIGRLAPRMDVLRLATVQYAVCGGLCAALGLIFDLDTLPGLAAGGWAIVYTGIASVALGYTLQVNGQKHAPPAHAAILLSMESVFAALFGWLFLGERLAPVQLAGCGLILAGMLIAQLRALAPVRREPAAALGATHETTLAP